MKKQKTEQPFWTISHMKPGLHLRKEKAARPDGEWHCEQTTVVCSIFKWEGIFLQYVENVGNICHFQSLQGLIRERGIPVWQGQTETGWAWIVLSLLQCTINPQLGWWLPWFRATVHTDTRLKSRVHLKINTAKTLRFHIYKTNKGPCVAQTGRNA